MLAILLLLLVGGGLFVYKNFFAEEVVVDTASVEREAENTRRLLDQINRIDLDKEFLDSPLVNTLANFYVTPEKGAPGKNNPFTAASGGLSNQPLPLEEEGLADQAGPIEEDVNVNEENEL